MKTNNIILNTDSYKVSHYLQYPPQTTSVYSYFESRPGARFPETVFFGLQYYIKEYLAGVRITPAAIDQAAAIWAKHFGTDTLFNRSGWQYIVDKHGGMLPVSIKAVPEGTVVPTNNVLMTVENTDPACFWLTNYLETVLTHVWYASTVATQSRMMKKTIKRYLEETGGDLAGLPFKLHDFGFRGVSSVETAAFGGAAHLVNFMGTDTAVALVLAAEYYACDMAGFSIPAAEHSTITSWGREHEVDAFRNMLTQFPMGLVAVVSDSYNIYEACSVLWGEKLKAEVLNRDGVLVVRPDSGKAEEVVPLIHELLGAAFGYTVNDKGFKVLNPKLAIIQGDGIDIDSLEKILEAVKQKGWSTGSLAFGSGGGLLQKMNRDTQRFAFKCSSATIGGVYVDVHKDPVTDHGKRSKKGRLKLVNDGGVLKTVGVDEPGDDIMIEVFRDGQLLVDYTFDQVRKNASL